MCIEPVGISRKDGSTQLCISSICTTTCRTFGPAGYKTMAVHKYAKKLMLISVRYVNDVESTKNLSTYVARAFMHGKFTPGRQLFCFCGVCTTDSKMDLIITR